MVNDQVIMANELNNQRINRNVVARKPDLTYDLETILDKLLDRVEA